MKPATELIHFDPAPGDPARPSSTPIHLAATFEQPSVAEAGPYDYSRSGNPTRGVLESRLAALEGGSRALAFASGLAAISNLMNLLGPGDGIVAGQDLYGGTHRLLSRILPSRGVTVRYADTTDLGAVEAALEPHVRLLLVESPSNPRLGITDLRAVSGLARARGVLLAVDNSLLSPWRQRPLALGADFVVHSATKFLGGHADLTGGAVVAADATLAGRLAWYQNAEGTALAPFDSWLLLRGLATLGVRVDRQEATARRIAEALSAHPAVTAVHYPGLPSHPGAALHASQAAGPGSVVSFTTGDPEVSVRAADACRLFRRVVSFGSVHSSISRPCTMSHASVPAGRADLSPLPPDLLRISIGLEDPEDLATDLLAALALAESSRAATDPRGGSEEPGRHGPPTPARGGQAPGS